MLNSQEILRRIRHAARSGNYVLTIHATERMEQRGFVRHDVWHALTRGLHEPAKDELKNGQWRHRIVACTLDGRGIRLAVSIEGQVIVVTVM